MTVFADISKEALLKRRIFHTSVYRFCCQLWICHCRLGISVFVGILEWFRISKNFVKLAVNNLWKKLFYGDSKNGFIATVFLWILLYFSEQVSKKFRVNHGVNGVFSNFTFFDSINSNLTFTNCGQCIDLGTVDWKKEPPEMFCKKGVSQISQETTCVGVTF